MNDAAEHLGLPRFEDMSASAQLAETGYRMTSRLAECIDAPLIPQRSDEWFELRKKRITGSIVDTILRTNPFADYEELVCEKAGMPVVFRGNEATAHGTKCEPIAISEYVRRTGRRVVELGLTPHTSTPLLAHSPDGISLSLSSEPVLLEIKCPLRRTIKPGKVPPYYMGQSQMGMDLFDVNYAHFVQYKPATDEHEETFDLTVVPRENGWLERNLPVFKTFWEEVERWRREGWQRHPKYALSAQLQHLRHVCVM